MTDMPNDVTARFAQYSPSVRDRLLAIRTIIYDQADALGVGPLTETLKWNEPAYLTHATKAGSTIRLGLSGETPAIFVNCNTNLAVQFRDLIGDTLQINGKRAVLIPLDTSIPYDAVALCIARALTYHKRKLD